MLRHPVEIEFMVKARERELFEAVRMASYHVVERQPMTARAAALLHGLGHRLETLGLWLRKRYQPLTSCGLSGHGSGCRQACS